MKKCRWIALLVVAVAVAAWWPRAANAEEPTTPIGPHAHLRSDLDEANRTFQRAIEVLGRDREAGAALALDAAAQYRAVARSGNIQNHFLELNAANASMLGGDVGRAVVAYRRAERISPTDAGVRQGLAAARAAVGTRAPASASPSAVARTLEVVLVWRESVSRRAMVWFAAAAYVTAWGCAIGFLMIARRNFRRAGVLAGVAAFLAAGMLWADAWDRASVRSAVIVQAGVVGLNGPAAGVYEPTYTSPLAPGVECVVIEHRGDWTHVRLTDGGQTWVPSSALDMV